MCSCNAFYGPLLSPKAARTICARGRKKGTITFTIYPTCCFVVRLFVVVRRAHPPAILNRFASNEGLTTSDKFVVAVISDPRAARSLCFSPSENGFARTEDGHGYHPSKLG